jgi:malonate transporter
MMDILLVTAPIYMVIGIGFAATRYGVMQKTDGQALGRFVMNFALPAMLFNALASRNFKEVLHVDYLAAYALGSLLAFATVFAWARWGAGKSTTLSSMMALGSSSSNSGYIGYPILLQLLGPVAGVGLALTLLVENLVMIPLGLSMAESGEAEHANMMQLVRESLLRLFKMPMMWGISSGFVYSMLGLHLPDMLGKTVHLFSAACAGIALFVNGGALVGLQVSGLAKQVSGVALAKLVVHPLGVAFFFWLFGPVDQYLFTTGIVLAAVPMLSIYPILGGRFKLEGVCAAALLVTTLVSFITINAVVWWLG